MSKRKDELRANALNSLKWARKFRNDSDIEYYSKSLDSFRQWREKSKAVA